MLKKLLILCCISLPICAGKQKESLNPYLQMLIEQGKLTKKAARNAKHIGTHTVIDYRNKEERTTTEWKAPQQSKKIEVYSDYLGNKIIKNKTETYIKIVETKPL